MFKYFVLLSSLLMASAAAWFSIFGISQLFIGAVIPATIMAISLEIGKIAAVSYVYRYWASIKSLFKIYLLFGSITLSFITSIGVYSYLSVAYSSSASQFSIEQEKIGLWETQKKSIEDELLSINIQITNLQQHRNQQENRLDSLIGKSGFITQQRIISESNNDIRKLRANLDILNLKKDSITTTIMQNKTLLYDNSKIGTFWYIAQTLGQPLDKIVQWFILLIVLVFDPMALSLIIAYNSIVKKNNLSNDKENTFAVTPTIVDVAPPVPPVESSEPYYTNPNYDWEHDTRWITDEAAKLFRQRAQMISQ